MHIDKIEEIIKSSMEILNNVSKELLNKDIPNKNVIDTSVWHLRGLLHHQQSIHEYYKSSSAEIAIRYNTTPCDVFVFENKDLNKLYYEFYAFINLSKITLDNLRYLLSESFSTRLNNIPKSFSDIFKGKTDHPSILNLQGKESIKYLIDMRNCIAHYRTLATSSINIAIREKIELPENIKSLDLFKTFAQLHFRADDPKNITVNILIPDKIYDIEAQQKFVPEFTYVLNKNLMSYTNLILNQILQSYLIGFDLINDRVCAKYTYG